MLTQPATYSIARLYYDNNQRLWLVLNETGDRDSEGNPTNCVRTRCTEFRYDSGRARYMTRSRNPNTLVPNDDAQWSDYDGIAIDLDYSVNRATGAVTLNRRHVTGLAQQDAATAENTYFHGDQIDSSRVLCNDDGRPVRQIAYTAFGEGFAATGSPETRYTYAGGWGYEAVTPPDATTPLPWLHVGERWYDPATGRFLQRDPIGIDGGLNTYAYLASDPTNAVDPLGLELPCPGVPYVPPQGPAVTPEQAAINLLEATGGVGHVPVLDPGPAQTGVLIGSEVTSIACGGAAGYLAKTGVKIGIKIGIHGAHHYFPALARKAIHLQLNWWRIGVRGSGGVLRLPLW